jgi:hypothetical protein
MTPADWARIRRGLALAGFAVGLLAIGLDDRRLGWAAIALLSGALLLRVARRRGGPSV